MYRRDALKKTAIGMGIVLSGTTIATLMESCSPSKAKPNWIPAVFTKEQALTIATLLEVIIPETDTPGAKSLQLEKFVDIIMDHSYETEEKDIFLKELNIFMENIHIEFDTSFEQCTKTQKEKIVQRLETSSLPFPDEVWGKLIVPPHEVTFYRKLKGMALLGYFSSEAVGKHILNYDPLPGKHIGCIPLSDVGNSWTEG